jgi:hypothetical protein
MTFDLVILQHPRVNINVASDDSRFVIIGRITQRIGFVALGNTIALMALWPDFGIHRCLGQV